LKLLHSPSERAGFGDEVSDLYACGFGHGRDVIRLSLECNSWEDWRKFMDTGARHAGHETVAHIVQ
jgi:hypothetical protein